METFLAGSKQDIQEWFLEHDFQDYIEILFFLVEHEPFRAWIIWEEPLFAEWLLETLTEEGEEMEDFYGLQLAFQATGFLVHFDLRDRYSRLFQVSELMEPKLDELLDSICYIHFMDATSKDGEGDRQQFLNQIDSRFISYIINHSILARLILEKLVCRQALYPWEQARVSTLIQASKKNCSTAMWSVGLLRHFDAHNSQKPNTFVLNEVVSSVYLRELLERYADQIDLPRHREIVRSNKLHRLRREQSIVGLWWPA